MTANKDFDKVELTLIRSCVVTTLKRQDKKVELYEKRGKDLEVHYATMMRSDLGDIADKLDAMLKSTK